MLEFVQVAVGEGMPLGCARCAAPVQPKYLPADEVIASVRAVAGAWDSAPGPNIVLGGPDPFGHPELPALIAACVAAGAERIALETDAAALSVPANADGVLRAGVRHLLVRVLDTDTTRGDAAGGRPGRTRDAIAGIRAYLSVAGESGVPVAVTATVPVCRHTAGTLSSSIAVLASLGVHAVRLVPSSNCAGVTPALIAAACDTGMVNRLWVEVDPALPVPDSHALHAVAGEVRDA